VCISHFSYLSVFLTILHVLKCVFLIFQVFQFSRHTPSPTVCISNFSTCLALLRTWIVARKLRKDENENLTW
jgi:hypothetical protein